eukprot:CAMPEP_0178446176 /NCGR_PEP_ID=MMETSP0689_2-20121128/40639_1 /TAXON_ID=160604 /ORGANISM="Amphidinium massartii, Strain CS-259" /LENGTH=38 /DNA_ID= /DNA_START= /DNA_END= /DNA_ORIENTATION=
MWLSNIKCTKDRQSKGRQGQHVQLMLKVSLPVAGPISV